jgi:Putative adhesin
MKRYTFAFAAALLALTGCSVSLGDEGSSMQSHDRRTFPAVRLVHVQNVTGPIVVVAAKNTAITVDATRRAGSQGAIDRTIISYDRHGDSLDVETRYEKTGWFGDSRGASVDYRIAVPPNTDLEIENVSGPITIQGTSGDVRASQVSGPVRATLGRVDGSRDVNIKAVSGAITLAIARNSSATLNAESISGKVNAFFPTDQHKGMVGSSLRGRIGTGTGSIDLSTVSGPIDINSQ